MPWMVVERMVLELVESREALEEQRMGRVTWVDSWRMKKQGSFLPQEPTGKPEPPEKSKEAQRMEWRRMMEESRKRQDEVEMEDKISKESGKKKKRKKSTAVGGEGGKVSDILSFWRRRESTGQTAVQETLVTRKRKIQEPGEHLSCENRKKLCVGDESEMGEKLKS